VKLVINFNLTTLSAFYRTSPGSLKSSIQQSSRFQVAKVDNGHVGTINETQEGPINSSPNSVHQMSHHTNTYYDTRNLKSLRHYTREALPRVDHYRNVNSVYGHQSRPTLDDLHGYDGTIVTDKNKVKLHFFAKLF